MLVLEIGCGTGRNFRLLMGGESPRAADRD
jgi:hypothetical protein